MSFYLQLAATRDYLLSFTHPITRLCIAFANRLHNAALLVCNIAHPVCLASRNNQMRTPSLHVSIQLFRLVNLKFAWVLDAATGAVVQAVVAIYRGVGGREEVLRLLSLGELVTILQRRNFGRRKR
jgi:hypothetical protein